MTADEANAEVVVQPAVDPVAQLLLLETTACRLVSWCTTVAAAGAGPAVPGLLATVSEALAFRPKLPECVLRRPTTGCFL